MAKPVEIEDILPQKPEFELGGEVYTLRPPNMLDQVWIKDTFGDEFGKILPNNDWPRIAKFVYRLLDERGQSDFRARKVKIINEETGEECERFFTAAEVLLTKISNLTEASKIMGAVYRAIAISNPMIEEVVKKKMGEELAKLTPPPSSVGQKSSTPSKVSTNGKRRTSRR